MSAPTVRRRRKDSIAAEAAFRARVIELGGTVVGEWRDVQTPVDCVCGEGHPCSPAPSNVRRGQGICRTCVGHSPDAAESAFCARVVELGGLVVGRYAGVHAPVDCICGAGHSCRPYPSAVQQGQGICRTCGSWAASRKKVLASAAAFRARVAELGGQVVGEYVDALTPVDCICRQGHRCRPWPSNIQQGQGMCRTCTGLAPAAAETAFRASIAELGGRVVGEYVNSTTPVDCLCVEGHPCRPWPTNIQRGQGMCGQCAGKDPIANEARFRSRIAELGGQVVGEYRGVVTPVECICADGHHCRPWPSSIQQGQHMCRRCAARAGTGPRASAAEEAFRAIVVKLGGTVVGEYVDATTAVDCVCRGRHACRPRPSTLQQGGGMCRTCSGSTWDVFYVVTNPLLGRVKFGITSNDERQRLSVHRRAGYDTVVRVLPGLPDAHALERNVLAALRDAGVPAVHGREYFDLCVLAVVLDVLEGWTGCGDVTTPVGWDVDEGP